MMMATQGPKSGGQRRDRLLRERVHDTYRSREKLSEPTCCPECGVVYRRGRWQWATATPGAHEQMCPACERVRDDYPGGELTIGGAFAMAHRDEIVSVARHEEERARADHPLERIIRIATNADSVVITTTGAHLGRAIGTALRNAYAGELDFHYVDESDFLRVKWSRDS